MALANLRSRFLGRSMGTPSGCRPGTSANVSHVLIVSKIPTVAKVMAFSTLRLSFSRDLPGSQGPKGHRRVKHYVENTST